MEVIAPPATHIVWTAEMRLLTNRYFLYDAVKLIAITAAVTAALMTAIMGLSGSATHLPEVLGGLGLVLYGFALLFGLVSVAFFGNRFPMRFLVAPGGVAWESLSRRGAASSRVAAIAGALAGSAATAGAGLLAMSEESGLLAWTDIRAIKADAGLRVITLRNGWRVVTRLYCTPENYRAVVEAIRRFAAIPVEERPAPAATAGREPVGVFELLRRAALAGGACAALWFAFDGPPVLVQVSRADFDAEFERRYGEPRTPPLGVMEFGREFIRRNTRPPSREAFVARVTEGRLLRADGRQWAALYAGANQPRWFTPEDPAVRGLYPELQRVYREGAWLSGYLRVPGAGYLELRYENEPRESKAPRTLVYPRRAQAAGWLLGGLLIYVLLPWPKPGAWLLLRDRFSTVGLDVAGFAVAPFFFGLPLYADSSISGLTLFLWTVAAAGALLWLWSARRAAWFASVEQGRIRFGRLFGSLDLAAGSIAAVRPVARGEARIGVQIERHSGRPVRVDWNGAAGFENLLWALHNAGVPSGPEAAA